MSQKKHLITGPIGSDFISERISSHQSRTQIGAHSIFLGQVRADENEGRQTEGIEYSAYEEMIGKVVSEIKDNLFQKYDDLSCVHIWHSIGFVKVGEVSLFVFVSSGHRKQAFGAIEDCVEQIKKKLPVWKKEIFTNGTHLWQGI